MIVEPPVEHVGLGVEKRPKSASRFEQSEESDTAETSAELFPFRNIMEGFNDKDIDECQERESGYDSRYQSTGSHQGQEVKECLPEKDLPHVSKTIPGRTGFIYRPSALGRCNTSGREGQCCDPDQTLPSESVQNLSEQDEDHDNTGPSHDLRDLVADGSGDLPDVGAPVENIDGGGRRRERQEVQDDLRDFSFVVQQTLKEYVDVTCGNKNDVFSFVRDIHKAQDDSGVILEEFRDIFGLTEDKNQFRLDEDILRQQQFGSQPVFLYQVRKTGQLVVVKRVRLEMDERFHHWVVPRHQQVEFPLHHQDECTGITKLYGVGRRCLQGQLYAELYTEFCQGLTLTLDHVAISNQLKKTLAESLLKHLQYLHYHGIVHGDIKLENIVLRDSVSSVCFIDFESAKCVNYRCSLKATAQYMPIWLHAIKKALIPPVDIEMLKTMDMWAIGGVFNFIFFGKLLWRTQAETCRRCHSCNLPDSVCLNANAKMLCHITTNPRMVIPYLPTPSPTEDDPLVWRFAELVRGLLPVDGPHCQLDADNAFRVLDESNIIINMKMNNIQCTSPVVVPRGTRLKEIYRKPEIQKMKDATQILKNGFYLTRQVEDGRWRVMYGSDVLMSSCVLKVHPTKDFHKA